MESKDLHKTIGNVPHGHMALRSTVTTVATTCSSRCEVRHKSADIAVGTDNPHMRRWSHRRRFPNLNVQHARSGQVAKAQIPKCDDSGLPLPYW